MCFGSRASGSTAKKLILSTGSSRLSEKINHLSLDHRLFGLLFLAKLSLR